MEEMLIKPAIGAKSRAQNTDRTSMMNVINQERVILLDRDR